MISRAGENVLTWERYLDVVLPEVLTESGVDSERSAAIVADITRRADAYTASGWAARRMLRVPFFDDVADFEPHEAPIGCKADIAVVVRNSLLEDAHANGPLDSADLMEITHLACGAFNAWSLQRPEVDEDTPPVDVFAAVGRYPRAVAALQALAAAARDGGRQSFRLPDGPVPALPDAGEHVESGGKIRRSGIGAPDVVMLAQLEQIAANKVEFVFVSSLSRLSRDSTMLALAVEFALAYGGGLLTTNFLIRPGEVFARRPPLIAAKSHDPLSVITTDRLSGLHTKHVRVVKAGFGAREAD